MTLSCYFKFSLSLQISVLHGFCTSYMVYCRSFNTSNFADGVYEVIPITTKIKYKI